MKTKLYETPAGYHLKGHTAHTFDYLTRWNFTFGWRKRTFTEILLFGAALHHYFIVIYRVVSLVLYINNLIYIPINSLI